ncbi:hypothetical protein FBY39_1951 [Microbacterium sp. SLBN-146]|nr:hypothetical protein FBY39_1951 [Microbacterium sp. SLBN-146]
MDLAETPANDREEYLDYLTTNCAVPFRANTADRDRQQTFVHMHREFGRMTVFENTYSNYTGVRPKGVARSSDEKMITIGMPLGPMDVAQGDAQVRGSARSMVAFWGSRTLRRRSGRRDLLQPALYRLAFLGVSLHVRQDLLDGVRSFGVTDRRRPFVRVERIVGGGGLVLKLLRRLLRRKQFLLPIEQWLRSRGLLLNYS